jgi:hypothetical protein
MEYAWAWVLRSFRDRVWLNMDRLWMEIVFANVELPQPGAAQAAA